MHRHHAIAITALLLVLTLFSDLTARPIEIPVKEYQLKNGLTVLLVPMPNTDVMTMQMTVRVGSRNEVEFGKTGFAHFFEHMMFRGSKNYSRERRDEIIQQYGADANAWTSDDLTNYFITATVSALEPLLAMESDRFINLTYSREDFQTEAGAILGEYNTGRSDPSLTLSETLRTTAFERHTYGHTVMGYHSDILAMPRQYEHSLDFFRRYYRPDNAILTIAGGIDVTETLGWVKKYYGPWKPGYNPKPVPQEFIQTETREAALTWPTRTNPQLWMAWKIPAYSDTNAINQVLDVLRESQFSQWGNLYKRLVIDEQIIQSLRVEADRSRDPGLFTVQATLYDATRMDSVHHVISQSLSQAGEQLTQEQFARIKDHLYYAATMRLNDPAGVAYLLLSFAQLTGDFHSLQRYYDQLDALDLSTVKTIARRIFKPERLTVVTLKQEVHQ
ncbi:MAG: insulinase family protein [Lentisphaeria bacterium]|nr:insulinase family protein [Candidatus Neomarinimicrobiota bacterium]MCF7843103.1 insulinase family protein [Lentisphaeria bacterium]